MTYDDAQAEKFVREMLKAANELQDINFKGLVAAQKAKNEAVRNHLLHGAGRRLGVMKRSLEQIFSVYPPSNNERLTRQAIVDLQIFLHAFVINVAGIFDNWAWAYLLQHELSHDAVGGRQNVSLFKPAMQKLLPSELAGYLSSGDTQKWHAEYAKEYRDALAHRIPLYVPPCQLTKSDAERLRQIEAKKAECFQKGDWDAANAFMDEEESIGKACPYFLHDAATAELVYLHPQTICDALTVTDFGRRYYAAWQRGPSDGAA